LGKVLFLEAKATQMADCSKIFQQLNQSQRSCIVIIGGMLEVLALLISLRLAASFTISPDNYLYTIVLTVLFGIIGSVILLRMYNQDAAIVSYVFFACAVFIVCLLNISTYTWSRVLTVALSIIVQGLAVTFVYLLSTLPLRYRFLGRRFAFFSPYVPLLFSVLLAVCNIPALMLFPHTWTLISLIVYGFSLLCMLTMVWGILYGFQHLQAQDQSIASITIIGIILVLLSFTINSNYTLYQIPLLPTSVGFLLIYSSSVASGALIISVAIWGLHRWLTQSLGLEVRLLIIVALGGVALLLVGGVVVTANQELLRQGFANLMNHHPFIIPVMILPVICYVALLHKQLSGKAGFLSRRVVRGMLWFSLASCLIWGDLLINELAKRYVSDVYDQLFLHIGWFMMSLWLFPWLWQKARAVGDRMLYRDFYSYNRTLRNLSLALTRLRSFERICDFILPQLATLLNAEGVALLTRNRSVLQERSGQIVKQQSGEWNRFYFSQIEKGMNALTQTHFIELVQSALMYFASNKETSCLIEEILLLPLFYEGTQPQGFLCLGPKLNGEAYNRQDLSFLETLTAQLATLEVNTRYAEQLKASAQQLATLNHKIVRAQEDERRLLALELHDDVLQQAMLLTRELTDANNDPQVAAIIPVARSIVHSLRATCLQLRPPLLNELGLVNALQWLGRQAEKQGHLQVAVQYIGEQQQRLQGYMELTLYRIAQEALANVLKHAMAQKVRIRLRQKQDTITLTVADNGCGLQSHNLADDSLGLAGMAERMESIGGTLQIRSSPGRGFVVRAIVYHYEMYEVESERSEPVQ
jgi:signal transduction histidine kinase